MEWARWQPLMHKLKEHEKIGDNIDLLVSKLRREQLLYNDVPGSTVSERVEKLVADLDSMFDSHPDSFIAKFLEVLQSIPDFEDLAAVYTTNPEFADSKTPVQETDSGCEQSSSVRHFHGVTSLAAVRTSVAPEQKLNPALVEGRHNLYEVGAGISESHPQEQSSKEIIESLKSQVIEIKEKCDELQKKKDEEVGYLSDKLRKTEIQVEHAEQKAKQQERAFQIDRTDSANHIQALQVESVQLSKQLDEAQLQLERQVSLSESELQELQGEVAELQGKVVQLQTRVNQLEQEKEQLQTRVNQLEQEEEEKCSPATPPLKPIRKVKPTSSNSLLGCGCYGSVVEVKCITTGDIFAAKKFRGDDVKQKKFYTKFCTELTLLLQLKHDHIVCYEGFTTLEDSDSHFPALLMERLDTSLHEFFKPSEPNIPVPVPLSKKAHILLGVGKGLEYLHGRSVIHRDLTAKNVLLKTRGEESRPIAKIADFGNSLIVTDDPILQLESSSGLPGTLMYMPPEVLSGNYNAKLDIFSFGHVALFVCTQVFKVHLLPIMENVRLADGTKGKIYRSEVERRKEYFDTIKLHDGRRQYLPLIEKCLNDDAGDRPSASEVVRKLEELPIPTDEVIDSPVEANDGNGHAASPAESERPVWLQDSGEAKIDIN